mgnify:CR=1 FL=1
MRVSTLLSLLLVPVACQGWGGSSPFSASRTAAPRSIPAVTSPLFQSSSEDTDTSASAVAIAQAENKKLKGQLVDLQTQLKIRDKRIAELTADVRHVEERLDDFRTVFLATEQELKIEKRHYKQNLASFRYLSQKMVALLKTKVANAYKIVTNKRLRGLLKLTKKQD